MSGRKRTKTCLPSEYLCGPAWEVHFNTSDYHFHHRATVEYLPQLVIYGITIGLLMELQLVIYGIKFQMSDMTDLQARMARNEEK